jgi:hypothetical protein
MVRKKVEGDEDQRRAAAHEARKAGESPSERKVTTGASKQRTHVPDRSSLTHEERVAPVHQGKQRRQPEDRRAREPAAPPQRSFTGRGHPPYDEQHEQVFRALAQAEKDHGGEGVHLDEVARRAGLPKEETRVLLHDLVAAHRLVTELQQPPDGPDQGPRYETKPRI